MTEQAPTSEAAFSESYRKAYQKNLTATVDSYRTVAQAPKINGEHATILYLLCIYRTESLNNQDYLGFAYGTI